MIPLVILGAGGFGRGVREVVEAVNATADSDARRFDFLGFLDDDPVDCRALGDDDLVLGPVKKLLELPNDVQYVIGIASPSIKRRLDSFATNGGRVPATVIHPFSSIGRHRTSIDAGAIICSHVSISTNVALGRHAHLNMNCTIGHDATIKDYGTLFPGVHISGCVTVGEGATIGTGAVVIQGRTVGREAVIGAGASVVHDIPPGVTAVGVPARPL